jgi:hypothetical protein
MWQACETLAAHRVMSFQGHDSSPPCRYADPFTAEMLPLYVSKALGTDGLLSQVQSQAQDVADE